MSEVTKEYIKIDMLKAGFRNVNLIAKVINIGEPRAIFSRRDRSEHLISEAIVGDETGTVLLTLWDDLIDAFKSDDVLEITNSYTSLFKGSLRLNLSRNGTLKKIDKKIEEVDFSKNLSEKRHDGTFWQTPSSRPFRRRRRRF